MLHAEDPSVGDESSSSGDRIVRARPAAVRGLGPLQQAPTDCQPAHRAVSQMSWQTYVDEHLLCELPKGGVLSAAAIVGQDGGVWAHSPEFPALQDGEVRLTAMLRPPVHLLREL